MYKDPRFIVLENNINKKYANVIANQKANDEAFEHKFIDLLEFDQKHAHKTKTKYLRKKEQTLAVAKFQRDFQLGMLKLKYEKSRAVAVHDKIQLLKIKQDIKRFKISARDKLNQKSFGVLPAEANPKQKYRKAQLVAWERYNADKTIVEFKMRSQLLLAKIDEKSISQFKRLYLLKKHDFLELKHNQSLELKKNKNDAKQIGIIKTKFEKYKLAVTQKYEHEIAKHRELLEREKKNHPLIIAKKKYRSAIEHCKSTFTNSKQRHKENNENLSKKFSTDKAKLANSFETSRNALKAKYKKQVESIVVSNANYLEIKKSDASREEKIDAKNKYKENKAEAKNKRIFLKKEYKANIVEINKTFDNNANELHLKFITSIKHENDAIKIASNELFAKIAIIKEQYKVDLSKAHEHDKDLIKPHARYREALGKIQKARQNFHSKYKEEIRDAKIKFKEYRYDSLKNLNAELKTIKNNFLIKNSRVKAYYDSLKRRLTEKKKDATQRKNANFDLINKQIDKCNIDKNTKLSVLANNYKMRCYALVSDVDKKINMQWSKLNESIDSIKAKISIYDVTFHERRKQLCWDYRYSKTDKIKKAYMNEFKRIRDAYQKHLFSLYLQYRHDLGLVSESVDAIPGTIEWYKLTKIDPAFAQMDKDIQDNIKEFAEYSNSNKELFNLNKKNKVSVLPTWAPIFINIALIISWSWTIILIILIFLGAFGVVPQFVFAETDGTLSMFGVIACSIFAIVVVLNFAGFLLHNVNIKSMKSIEVKKRNDMIVFLQNQIADYNKKINQLSKISKNGNDLIYKKSLSICKQTTDDTLNKLKQNINEKNEQLSNAAKRNENEIGKLERTNARLISQKKALEKKMLRLLDQSMKKAQN